MLKTGRNDACWCGSGKKYKNCHLAFDQRLENYAVMGDEVPEHHMIKTPAQIEGIRHAGVINNQILDIVSENIKAGMTTQDINTLVHENTIRLGGIPAPLILKDIQRVYVPLLTMWYAMGFPVRSASLRKGILSM